MNVNLDIEEEKNKSSIRMNNVAKVSMWIMIATMLAKALGFIRELVLASSYGTSAYSDAYLVALNIPNVIFTAIGTAISTIFIPIYCEANNIGGKKESIKFTTNILNIIAILSILVSILALLFIEPIVKVFAIGFEGETLRITIIFSKILIFSILFISTSEIAKSFLNANNNFTVPTIMMSIPFNIIVIVSIILSTKTSPYILAIGTLLGFASKLVFQIPYIHKYEYKYTTYLNLKDKYIKKSLQLLAPVFIGVAVNQLNAMIDRSLASTLVSGSISALNYANRLNNFVLTLFIGSISVVIFPILSKLSIEKNKDRMEQLISKSLNSVTLLIMPISIGAIVLAKPIVTILFQRGAFDELATDMTSTALIYYSLGLIAFSFREILNKIFYSYQDTRTPMINASLSLILNIALNIILVRYMGHNGLALATSISGIICIILLFKSLSKKIGYFGQEAILSTMLKSLLASVIMGFISLKFYDIVGNFIGTSFIGNIISLGIALVVGMVVYGVLVIMLKVNEIELIVDTIKHKLKK